jgi:hypothetical protein
MIERKFGDATLEYAKRRRVEKEATEFAAKDAVLAARLRKSVDLIRGVGGDPAMQNHFDNLVNLAEQLRIRAPQLELQP